MFNLSFFELTIFGIIALIVLGPDKLIQTARAVGRWYAFLKKAKDRLQNEMLNELDLLQTQEQLKQEIIELRNAETQIKAQVSELQDYLHQTSSPNQNFTQKSMTQNDDSYNSHSMIHTSPLTNRFFLLSDYDRKRRLPPPPFLAKTVADKLLF